MHGNSLVSSSPTPGVHGHHSTRWGEDGVCSLSEELSSIPRHCESSCLDKK